MVAVHVIAAWLVLGCTAEPTAHDVAERIRADDLAGARELAGEQGPFAQHLERLTRLEHQQARLREASLPRVFDAAQRALGAQDWVGALLPTCEALTLDPMRARPLVEQLGAALREHHHADGLRALQACDASASAQWAAAADSATHAGHAASAYAGDAAIATLALSEGISQDEVTWVLDTLDTLYVTVPNWARLAEAGAARLSALGRDPGARRILGEGSPLALPEVSERGDIAAHLGAALDAWPTAPRSLVLAEWTSGALTALDAHTRVVWPAEIAAWEAHHAGVSLDAGVELVLEDGAVRVDALALGSPAYTAGMHVGDEVVFIGEQNLDTHPPDERLALARRGLAGAAGSTLTVTVQRDARPHALDLTLVPYRPELVTGRERKSDNTWSPWLSPGIAYVRIDAFRPWVDEAFDDLLEPHLGDVRALIIDLRGNGGGDVSAAVNVADRFVADGILADMDGRALPDTDPGVDPETGQALAAWNDAVPGHALEGVPVAVLVDRSTASASEILAGSLRQRAGARLFGESTVGKGRSQRLVSGPRAALQVTNLRWTLPDGSQVDGVGLEPDVPMALGPGARLLLEERHRRRRRLAKHADGSSPPTAPPASEDLPPLAADPVITRAQLWLRASLTPPE